MNEGTRSFLKESARYLRDVHLPRIERAVDGLAAEDVWWTPRPGMISIGTVLSHLEGNVHEWILAALGGEDYVRDRKAEFAATDGPPARELLASLRATVEKACGVVAGLDEERLSRRYTIQGNDLTGLESLYHVVEHFAYHTGQASWIAKARR